MIFTQLFYVKSLNNEQERRNKQKKKWKQRVEAETEMLL